MGIGPAPAIRKALKAAKLELKDMSLVEVSLSFFMPVNSKYTPLLETSLQQKQAKVAAQ